MLYDAATVVLTGFTLSNNDIAPLQDVLEPLEVNISFRGPGSSSGGHDGLFHGKLDNQSLYAMTSEHMP